MIQMPQILQAQAELAAELARAKAKIRDYEEDRMSFELFRNRGRLGKLAKGEPC